MIFWIAIAAIAGLVVAALLLPLFGSVGDKPPRRQRELAIYQDQLAELEREHAAGRISTAEAEAAATEIKRKMLASAATVDRADEVGDSMATTRIRLVAVLAVGSLTPLGALLVYLSVGSPAVPAYPFDPARQAEAQADASAHSDAEIESMIATLAERMKQDPNNLEGWALLARSYSALKRHAEAAQTYERVYALSKNSVAYAGDYGEALTLAADGEVVPMAHKLFQQVVERDPGEPRARYYLALALAQSGKPRDAIALWRGLEADSPPDAPWLPAVREVVQMVADEAGIDPATVPPAGRAEITRQPGPTAEDVAAAQELGLDPASDGAPTAAMPSPAAPDAAADQAAMIQSMVDGLAQRLQSNPDDLDGWKRLGRSYLVLNEPVRAQEAYAHAVTLAPTDRDVLAGYADATMLAPGTVTVPTESIATLRGLLAANGTDSTALWLIAVAEADAGNRPQAAELLKRLLEQLPEDGAAYRTVQARLEQLSPAP